MKQILLTPAAGKRLIGMAIAVHPHLLSSLENGIVAIVAGTTNGYVAEEILRLTGNLEGFSRDAFFRGITMPPSKPVDDTGRLAGHNFPGDVIIVKGDWQKGKTLSDVAGEMKSGDLILKGANSVNINTGTAAVLVGHPQGGTIIEAMKAVAGRRTRLIIPVGLEKRVSCSLEEISRKINSPGASGLRMISFQGEIVTELEAISLLSGATASLFAGGGVCGAEGSVWIAVEGGKEKEEKIKNIVNSIKNEPPFLL